ncbi:MAG TPA: polyribonucleotide nucleotidyltransferase [Gemmatimonadota bacterium]|nr:polyribonucleotide nucleotidyltransferase [Gemmatimonadota bacterium]
MATTKKVIAVGDRDLIIETGKMARLAGGAVTVQQGETVVLCTATASPKADSSRGWFPLFVEYREKMYAAGKIPGGFFKREGRPGEKETLSARLIDRPCRPLFPEGFMHETQLVCQVLSYDGANDPDVLGIVGCGAALSISGIPFEGPVAGVRVGLVDGAYAINPTQAELEASPLDVVVAGTADSVSMVEGSGDEVSETELLGAIRAGHEAIAAICAVLDELKRDTGRPAMGWSLPARDADLAGRVAERARGDVAAAMRIADKEERNSALEAVRDRTVEVFAAEMGDDFGAAEGQVRRALENVEYEVMRTRILEEGRRADDRGPEDIRPITIEVGLLPRAHGSALFTRGSTQSLGVVTLGTRQDEQMIDDLDPKWDKTFMLHYNFPPFSVGEVGRFGGTGRREIGHGALAERSLKSLLPPHEEFPYTIRIVSDILESNGSSSMASVCSGSLSLMDAGVPLRKACAGIAMGLVKEGERVAVLSDILGIEDHLGDMDFKVAGTREGITGFQMDIKIKGVSFEILERALEQARRGRMHILGEMESSLGAPRESISIHAPRILTIIVPKAKIRDVIGSGGKVIRGLQEETGAKIDIDDAGVVTIASIDGAGGEEALRRIEKIIEEPEIGKIYEGPVKSITTFGAFVEILPGRDGLVHISELEHRRVERVEDVTSEGEMMRVKLIGIDNQGRVKLSRKALLEKPEGAESAANGSGEGGERTPRGDRADRGDRGERGGRGRGPRRGGRDRR